MKITLTLLTAILLASCDNRPPTATELESTKQEQMTLQGVQTVGLPAITNFQEKRVLKQILELRDTKIVTVTYTQSLDAKLHKLCDSIGYGIPYATQYTNPMMISDSYANYWRGVLPQADPNGLYSPASAEGTWVLCLNPKTKDVAPVYVEPRIVVSPFPLTAE